MKKMFLNAMSVLGHLTNRIMRVIVSVLRVDAVYYLNIGLNVAYVLLGVLLLLLLIDIYRYFSHRAGLIAWVRSHACTSNHDLTNGKAAEAAEQ